jgi:hypothetical protein
MNTEEAHLISVSYKIGDRKYHTCDTVRALDWALERVAALEKAHEELGKELKQLVQALSTHQQALSDRDRVLKNLWNRFYDVYREQGGLLGFEEFQQQECERADL